MKRLLGACVILAGVAAGCGAALAEDGIDWKTDLDAARAEAKRTGRPMLAVFR